MPILKVQLETYDRYWESISTEKTLMLDAFDEGKIEGKQEEKLEIAKKLKEEGLDLNFIIETTGLNKENIEKL